MPPAPSFDQQRALFRFLTKAARKGELAADAAALARIGGGDLPAAADAMQQRLWEIYPHAPDLRVLLGEAAPADWATWQAYDWVTAGSYAFGLPPTKTRAGTAASTAHRALKEWAAAHGELLGAPAGAAAQTEVWFPHGAEADAAFFTAAEALIIEVRPDPAEPPELQQALYSLAAMRAVRAVAAADGTAGVAARTLLVVEAALPPDLAALAARLDVQVYVKAAAAGP